MATSRRRSSKINAGSMADIAFLLLIFFLVVSTIEDDVGINRKLPKLCETDDCSIDIDPRNLFTIELNGKNELLINKQLHPVSSLQQRVMDFIDNNGSQSCHYCNGLQAGDSSDNPGSAVISILSSREADYEAFIKVQDELAKAYFALRQRYASSVFNKPVSKLTEEELRQVKEAYPFQISEAELKH